MNRESTPLNGTPEATTSVFFEAQSCGRFRRRRHPSPEEEPRARRLVMSAAARNRAVQFASTGAHASRDATRRLAVEAEHMMHRASFSRPGQTVRVVLRLRASTRRACMRDSARELHSAITRCS
jgi:hypothetical protein